MVTVAENEGPFSRPVVSMMVFVLLLLVSLFGFRSAWIEAAGHGWTLKFHIAAPWIFCALAGLLLWQGVRLHRVTKDIANALFPILGVVAMFAGEAMAQLGNLGRY